MTDNSPVFTARAYLDAIDVQTRLTGDVILVFDQSVVEPVGIGRRITSRLLSGEERVHPFRGLHRVDDGTDLVVTSPGAAVAGATLELLAAMGARRVVSVGAAAALTDLGTGTLAVVERAAWHGEALAYPSTCDTPTASLSKHLASALPATPVTAWSTSVPFRQSPAVLEQARQQAQVLEMECGALFQVADVLGLDMAAVVVVSDHYDRNTWRPGNPGAVTTALRAAVSAVVAALGES